MAWDSETPKLGDTISIMPGGVSPKEQLLAIAEIVLAQAEEYAADAKRHRERADQCDERALGRKALAATYIAAANRCEAP